MSAERMGKRLSARRANTLNVAGPRSRSACSIRRAAASDMAAKSFSTASAMLSEWTPNTRDRRFAAASARSPGTPKTKMRPCSRTTCTGSGARARASAPARLRSK